MKIILVLLVGRAAVFQASGREILATTDCGTAKLVNGKCICYIVPGQPPLWDPNTRTCIQCQGQEGTTTPYWDNKKHECTKCPDKTPHWDGDNCVACASLGKSETPYWNGQDCSPCDQDKPFWNGEKCVACDQEHPVFSDGVCKTCYDVDATKPKRQGKQCVACGPATAWSTNAKECRPCVDVNTDAPYWNTDTKQCTTCPADKPKWVQNAGTCKSCFQLDADRPSWDGNDCVACGEKLVWSQGACKPCDAISIEKPFFIKGAGGPSTDKCVACPKETPIWSQNMPPTGPVNIEAGPKPGGQCVSCKTSNPTQPQWTGKQPQCAACPYNTPVYNEVDNSCTECLDPSKPLWNPDAGVGGACEECSSDKPFYERENMRCTDCPSDRPVWDGSKCKACSATEHYNWRTRMCVFKAQGWQRNIMT